MKSRWGVWPAALIFTSLILETAPLLLGHHSAAADYYSTPIVLKGKVTRVAWMNPHVWIYFDTTDRSGAVTHWECEGGAPGGLIGNGWTRETLKAGDRVTLEGSRAKDRASGFKVRAVILANGRRLSMGTN